GRAGLRRALPEPPLVRRGRQRVRRQGPRLSRPAHLGDRRLPAVVAGRIVGMTDPLLEREFAAAPLALVAEAAGPYLDSLADRPVVDHDAAKLIADLTGPLPEV